MKIPFFNSDIKGNNEEITQLNIADISANPFQPRREFKDSEIEELADSINNFGLIQPITVRKKNNKYQLIAGERRLRAAKKLGKDKIPAVIKNFADQEMAEIALVENLQRKDLNFLEEAAAYQRLLEEFDLSQKELAERLSKGQSTIANKLRLLQLNDEIQELLIDKNLSERHGRALLKLDSAELQLEILNKIAAEELTVRESEKLIESALKPKKKAKKKIKHLSDDLRLFANSLEKTLKEIKSSGIEVEMDRNYNYNDDYIEYKIKLAKNNGKSKS
ncbi:nucleoid occlusion protein [Halanaerobium sp. Z-7514]|uniref:Nucleoid occlusion protein n=1 Tax=Halanaerobium polyolivorans TaxID=2886943 RepID=A0AAW4WUD9_9FIRM|nr:nucleoid occlusion protein [Halanaerobium polyolivorans]MCC3144718.1 nucleoid occlusion protein [Halanaerobium polyolivorans]